MVLGRATEISDGVSDGDKHNSDGTNEISGRQTPRAQYYMEILEGVSDDRLMRQWNLQNENELAGGVRG